MNSKTFDVLLYLAEHPQQVVAREELIEAVWPGSFVEESNLYQHVFRLRRVFADAGAAGPIVVTVPGKGYQFAAAVLQAPRQLATSESGEAMLHAVSSVTRMTVEEETEEVLPERKELAAPAKPRRAWSWAVGTAAALALLAAGSFLAWRHWRPKPADHVDLVLAELLNSTGDPDFDRVLNQALLIDLEQSPFLNLLPKSKVKETLVLMQRKGDETLTPELAREICERNNAQAALHGALTSLGGRYLLMLDAESCVNGRQIAGYKAEAGSKAEVLRALDEAAGRVREQLGESAASLERFQTPVEQATTTSLEALRAFSLGRDDADRGDIKTAQALYQRAIALDPNFASAYFALGAAYYNLSDLSQASLYAKKAFDLREHTTARERLNIEIAYYYFGNRDTEAAVRSLKLYIQTYPNGSARSWANLCNLYTQMGDYKQAIAAGEVALRLDPRAGSIAETVGRAYKRATRFEDAKRAINAGMTAGKDRWGFHSILFQIAYAERDAARIKSEGEWGLSHQQRNIALDNLAYAAATGGKLREALDEFSRAQAESLRDGDADFAGSALRGKVRVLVELGESGQARALLKSHRGDANDEGDLALLQAMTGDIAPARLFVASYDSSKDRNTLRIFYDLPVVRAALALQAHEPKEAIELLEPARPYQLRDFQVPYLRAQAETETGLLDAAAEDYRLILANQGVDPISPLYSLAHLRLARVLVQQKKADEARQQYRAFLDAWKDADSGLSILRSARMEFARLR
ncbi:MAG: winged helix-turn-helix domain-containing protein [Bryobacteraceae bacterium]